MFIDFTHIVSYCTCKLYKLYPSSLSAWTHSVVQLLVLVPVYSHIFIHCFALNFKKNTVSNDYDASIEPLHFCCIVYFLHAI